MIRIPFLLGGGALVVTVILFSVGILIPLAAIFAQTDFSKIGDPVILAVARATVWQALWSTVFSGLVGLPLGIWFGRSIRNGVRPIHRVTEVFLALPFGIPTVIAAFAWVSWLGRSGILAKWGFHGPSEILYSLNGIILAHVFFNAPWVALFVSYAVSNIPNSHWEAAATMGSRGIHRFCYLIFPWIKRTWLGSLVQVFSLCSMSFALVLLLGGGPPVQTLETALYSKIRLGTLDISGAAACAFWEMLITLTPWILFLWIERDRPALLGTERSKITGPLKKWDVLLSGVCFLFLVPYLSVLSPRSFLNWIVDSRLRIDLGSALEISLKLCAVTSILSVVSALIAVGAALVFSRQGFLRKIFLSVLAVPSGISILVLGLGFWLAYGNWIDPFAGSFWAIASLQTTIYFPIVLRILWPLANQSRLRLLESAVLLGSSPQEAFLEIEWPRWRPVVLSSLAIVAAGSMGEVAAVSLFYSENLVPLPLLISRWMSQYRFEDGHAASALLFMVSVLVTVEVFLGRSRFERTNR
ncbi:MAG: ABC transporter permease subunit [Bdellovibrionota bacterium]